MDRMIADRHFSIIYRDVSNEGELAMKIWMKPQVREQEVGLEVTSYLPAEIDVI
jgi:coenzyme PQQ precursor peptide PqqA